MTRPGARVLVRGRSLTDPVVWPSWRWECSECAYSPSGFWFKSDAAHDEARAHARTCTALHLARLREQVGAALVEMRFEEDRAVVRARGVDRYPRGRADGLMDAKDILTRLTGVPFPADAAVTE